MKIKQDKAGMSRMKFNTVNEEEEALKKVKDEQKEIVEKGKEIREKELLDYHHSELMCENEDQIKKTVQPFDFYLNDFNDFNFLFLENFILKLSS